MKYFFIFALIQGITEFLPISSSGHLAILENLFEIGELNYLFTIFLHLATLAVIVWYFFSDIKMIFRNKEWFRNIVAGFIATSLVVWVFRRAVPFSFQNSYLLGICFLITAIFLFLSDRITPTREEIGLKKALIIGGVQGFAIFPGISRSGITIAIAILLGLRREVAFKFSFLLAIPTILGAGIFEIRGIKNLFNNSDFISFYIFSFIIAFLTGMIGLRILKKVLLQKNFSFFGIYCCIIGIIILAFGGLKW